MCVNLLNITQDKISKNIFALRVFDIWISLSDIICCTNVKQFIYELKATDLSHFLKGHTRQEELTCKGLFLPF